MLNQEWSKLLNEIKEEFELTQTLFNYTKGNVSKLYIMKPAIP